MGFKNLFSFPIYLYFTLLWGIIFWSTNSWCSAYTSILSLLFCKWAHYLNSCWDCCKNSRFLHLSGFFFFYIQNGWEYFLNLQYFPCPFFCACLFVLTQSHHLLALFLTNCNGLIPNMCCQWIVCWHIWQYYHLLQSLINFSVFILWKFNKQTSNLEKEMSARCVG